MHSLRALVIVWFVLLLLLALSVASAWLDLGAGNVVANIGIASIKAALVAWFYMHLGHGTATLRIVALLGLVWLLFLIGLSLADYLTRPTPLRQPSSSTTYEPRQENRPGSEPTGPTGAYQL